MYMKTAGYRMLKIMMFPCLEARWQKELKAAAN